MLRMIMNKLLYVIIGTILGASLVYIGCGGKNSSLVISAKNIVFRSAKDKVAFPQKIPANKGLFNNVLVPSAYAQEDNVDGSLKVLAENVQVDTNDNSLESQNLQAALDNEMAIDIPSALSGKTWAVENRSASPDFDNCSGQITFISSSEFTMNSGKLAFPGIWAESSDRTMGYGGPASGYPYTDSVTVEFLSNNVMWVRWQSFADYLPGGSVDSNAVIQIIPVNKSKFIFAGYNPTTGHYGVSTLTLVE
jgi:hypothetical protein